MAKNDGFEKCDDRPVAVPVRYRGPVGEVDRLKHLMRTLIVEAGANGRRETLEESLDFNTGEDDDGPLSHAETRYMQEEKLLTEAEYAAKMGSQRRAVAQLKERFNVQSRDAAGDSRRVDRAGEVGAAVGGEGRSAGVGGAGVSEGGDADSVGAGKSGVRGAQVAGSGKGAA